MTTVVVNQPTYLPWLGYFELIARCDRFVVLDTVQLARSWQCRNRLKGPSGQPFFVTVPLKRQPLATLIRDALLLPDADWRERHLASVQSVLGRAPYFDELFPALERWYASTTSATHLAQVTVSGLRFFCELLGLRPSIVLASELGVGGRRADLLLALCQRLGARRYYSARGSSDYLEPEEERFRQAGIEVVYQTWAHPTYPQPWGPFVSHLSVVDALMNIGVAATRALIDRSAPESGVGVEDDAHAT